MQANKARTYRTSQNTTAPTAPVVRKYSPIVHRLPIPPRVKSSRLCETVNSASARAPVRGHTAHDHKQKSGGVAIDGCRSVEDACQYYGTKISKTAEQWGKKTVPRLQKSIDHINIQEQIRPCTPLLPTRLPDSAARRHAAMLSGPHEPSKNLKITSPSAAAPPHRVALLLAGTHLAPILAPCAGAGRGRWPLDSSKAADGIVAGTRPAALPKATSHSHIRPAS